MKVRRSYDASDKEIDLAYFIEKLCDGDDYGRGQVEASRETANNVAAMFGKLVDSLVEKKVLFAEDVSEIAGMSVEIIED